MYLHACNSCRKNHYRRAGWFLCEVWSSAYTQSNTKSLWCNEEIWPAMPSSIRDISEFWQYGNPQKSAKGKCASILWCKLVTAVQLTLFTYHAGPLFRIRENVWPQWKRTAMCRIWCRTVVARADSLKRVPTALIVYPCMTLQGRMYYYLLYYIMIICR